MEMMDANSLKWPCGYHFLGPAKIQSLGILTQAPVTKWPASPQDWGSKSMSIICRGRDVSEWRGTFFLVMGLMDREDDRDLLEIHSMRIGILSVSFPSLSPCLEQ